MTPGRLFSATTSLTAARRLKSCTAWGTFRFRVMPNLPRFRRWNPPSRFQNLSPGTLSGKGPRPSVRKRVWVSTFITSAPISAMVYVAVGMALTVVQSMTRIPDNSPSISRSKGYWRRDLILLKADQDLGGTPTSNLSNYSNRRGRKAGGRPPTRCGCGFRSPADHLLSHDRASPRRQWWSPRCPPSVCWPDDGT